MYRAYQSVVAAITSWDEEAALMASTDNVRP
jgi:hypothetical protein